MIKKNPCLLAILLLAGCASLAWGQSPDDSQSPPVCTDLTGKVSLPCPSSENADSIFKDDDGDSTSSPSPATHPAPRVNANQPRELAPQPVAAPAPSGTSAPQPTVHSASAPQPVPGIADPRASIGFYPKERPEPELEPVSTTVAVAPHSPSTERLLIRNLVQDQKDIWTSPAHLHLDDVQWLAPLLGAGAVLTLSDTDIQRHLPTSPNVQSNAKSFSDYGVYAFAGATGAAWLLGKATHNDHMRETGLLSGEAALDSFALTYAIKSITQRDRPFQGDGHGKFFSNGDSFPSEHAVAAWSMATVIAHEYPGPLTTFLAYAGAAGVTAGRVVGRQHFTSDAVIGSALGYFVGRHVYRAHHDQEQIQRYGTFERTPRAERPRTPDNMGSAFVPLDSWTYEALDRLAAMGYIHTAFAGLRPWTRLEFVRLLDEAGRSLGTAEGAGAEQALKLYHSLQAEFVLDAESVAGGRNVGAQLESIYTRVTGISGIPLTDGFHFGQTIINDYGRPYQQGFNAVSGFSARAEAGPLAFYVRGEYQHAPSAPAPSAAVANLIAIVDQNPVQLPTPINARNDFQLLDTYVALNLANNQFSFGRQSLWWGPGQGGALMFSDNALPFYMLRWNHVSPAKLPSVFGFLGPMRTDFFIGKLQGHKFPIGPYISGQKISFHPTENLDLGFSKISIFAGGGTTLTWHNFYKSTFSVNDRPSSDLFKFDVGDRRSGFNFSYRVPGLRKWLTLYSDSLSDDDPSPLAAPRRAAMNPGIYLSHVPALSRLDFRAEAAYTDVPSGGSVGGHFIYYNSTYHDSHLNAGNLMGSWVGREGKGVQLWSTYWISGESNVRLGYRFGDASPDFIGGGHLSDFAARGAFALPHDLLLSTSVQYERWNIPALSPAPHVDVTTSFQLTFRPRWPAK